MGQYLPLVALAVLAVLFGVLSVIVHTLLAPSRTTTAKVAPYECGIVPSYESPQRFPVRFYLVAMLFIMFDIEILFLYPYAVAHESLGGYGFVALLVFSGIFFLSFVYEIAKGGLEWGPMKRARRFPSMVSPGRTALTTVRRVGLEGREEEAA